jgi:hypothetical protein
MYPLIQQSVSNLDTRNKSILISYNNVNAEYGTSKNTARNNGYGENHRVDVNIKYRKTAQNNGENKDEKWISFRCMKTASNTLNAH